jgi:hypothetical protein
MESIQGSHQLGIEQGRWYWMPFAVWEPEGCQKYGRVTRALVNRKMR